MRERERESEREGERERERENYFKTIQVKDILIAKYKSSKDALLFSFSLKVFPFFLLST